MANEPKDYRNPKVTTSGSNSGMKWLWYALGALVILLLLAWFLGWFDAAGVDPVATEEPVTEEQLIEEEDDAVVVPD